MTALLSGVTVSLAVLFLRNALCSTPCVEILVLGVTPDHRRLVAEMNFELFSLAVYPPPASKPALLPVSELHPAPCSLRAFEEPGDSPARCRPADVLVPGFAVPPLSAALRVPGTSHLARFRTLSGLNPSVLQGCLDLFQVQSLFNEPCVFL